MKNKKGVIYDLDGTIISTTKLHEEGWKEVGRYHNVEITQQFLKDQKGITNEAAAKLILGEKFDTEGKSFVQIKNDYTTNNAGLIKFNEGFLNTYQELIKKGINIWICTSASKEFVASVYNKLPELQVLKDKTVFRDMYTRGKPDPEPLMVTAKLMGLSIQDCVYVGDAYSDYLAARNAGCEFVYFCESLERDPNIPETITVISSHTEILNFVFERPSDERPSDMGSG